MTQITLTEGGMSVTYLSTRPTTDIDQCVHDLAELRECVVTLRAWEDVLTEYLSDALGRNGIDVEEVGHVEIKRATDRKEWNKVDLLRMLLDSRRRPDEDTGEAHPSDDGVAYVGDEMITCSTDLSRVLDAFNLPAPRVTVLRERGIPVDELCSASPGKVSVVIT